MASQVSDTIQTLHQLQSFPISTLKRLSSILKSQINAWGNSESSTTDFILSSTEVDNTVNEMKIAKKIVDDLSNWPQFKQLEGGVEIVEIFQLVKNSFLAKRFDDDILTDANICYDIIATMSKVSEDASHLTDSNNADENGNDGSSQQNEASSASKETGLFVYQYLLLVIIIVLII